MSVTVYLRNILGRMLTFAELDANFSNLKSAVEAIQANPIFVGQVTAATFVAGVLDTVTGTMYLHSNGQFRLYNKNQGNFAGIGCDNTDGYADLAVKTGGGTTTAKFYSYGALYIGTNPVDDGVNKLQVAGSASIAGITRCVAAVFSSSYPESQPANRAIVDYYNGARLISTGSTTTTYAPVTLHQKSSGGSLYRDVLTMDVNGDATFFRAIQFTPTTSATPAANGNVVFEATNNTTIKIKLKGSDGIVRSATLTLA